MPPLVCGDRRRRIGAGSLSCDVSDLSSAHNAHSPVAHEGRSNAAHVLNSGSSLSSPAPWSSDTSRTRKLTHVCFVDVVTAATVFLSKSDTGMYVSSDFFAQLTLSHSTSLSDGIRLPDQAAAINSLPMSLLYMSPNASRTTLSLQVHAPTADRKRPRHDASTSSVEHLVSGATVSTLPFLFSRSSVPGCAAGGIDRRAAVPVMFAETLRSVMSLWAATHHNGSLVPSPAAPLREQLHPLLSSSLAHLQTLYQSETIAEVCYAHHGAPSAALMFVPLVIVKRALTRGQRPLATGLSHDAAIDVDGTDVAVDEADGGDVQCLATVGQQQEQNRFPPRPSTRSHDTQRSLSYSEEQLRFFDAVVANEYFLSDDGSFEALSVSRLDMMDSLTVLLTGSTLSTADSAAAPVVIAVPLHYVFVAVGILPPSRGLSSSPGQGGALPTTVKVRHAVAAKLFGSLHCAPAAVTTLDAPDARVMEMQRQTMASDGCLGIGYGGGAGCTTGKTSGSRLSYADLQSEEHAAVVAMERFRQDSMKIPEVQAYAKTYHRSAMMQERSQKSSFRRRRQDD